MNRTIILRAGSFLSGRWKEIDDRGREQMLRVAELIKKSLDKETKGACYSAPTDWIMDSAKIVSQELDLPLFKKALWQTESGTSKEGRFQAIRGYHAENKDSLLIIFTMWNYIEELPEMFLKHFDKFKRKVNTDVKEGFEQKRIWQENIFGIDIRWDLTSETIVINQVSI